MRRLVSKLFCRQHQKGRLHDEKEARLVSVSEGENDEESRALTIPRSVRVGDDAMSTSSSHSSECSVRNVIVLPFVGSTFPPTPQMELVRQMTDYMNRKDLAYFQMFHTGTKVNFEDMSLDLNIYHNVICQCFASFPDLHFHIDHLQQNEPDLVSAIVTVTATHTGVPFATPLHTQLVPTSNVRVKLDPELWELSFRRSRMREFRVESLGTYTGPNGLYVKLQKALAKRGRKS